MYAWKKVDIPIRINIEVNEASIMLLENKQISMIIV